MYAGFLQVFDMVCRGPALDVAALCANGVFPATGWAPLALRWRRAGIDNRKDGRHLVKGYLRAGERTVLNA